VLLPGALADFRRKYPKVAVTLRGGLYDTHLGAIREGVMDLAVGPVPVDLDPAVTHEPLFYNEVVIAARRGHPLAAARSLAELAESEWVVTSANAQGPGAAVFDAFAQHGLAPPTRLIRCDMTWALFGLLASTDCLCALPRPLLVHQPPGSGLVTIPLSHALPRYPVCLVHRADSPLLPAAAHMAALLRRHAHYHCRANPELAIASRCAPVAWTTA
jgi:DNA-binding transcriptional LysR family regulator